ncbi:MAG: precorrin-2 dehydrogenase/sirohydrochlorin ferrochelatase family protein [Alphaproteobacteria bacterium]
MYSFPIFLNLRHATPLVIGDGHLAIAKVRTLLLRATRVDIMTKKPLATNSELKKFLANGQLHRLPMPSPATTLGGWKKILAGRPLVILDPRLECLIAKLYPLCLELGLPINVADNIDKSSFSFGALVDRRPLTVAIATDGIVPVLATDIREKLEQAIPSAVGGLMGLAQQYRKRVNRILPMGLKRRLFWQDFLRGEVAELVKTGHIVAVDTAVEKLLARLVDGTHQEFRYRNDLFLLAVRPDDGLDDLSLGMVRAIKNADVVMLSGWIDIFSEILSLARREVVIKKNIKPLHQEKQIKKLIAQGSSVVMLVSADDYRLVKKTLDKHGMAPKVFHKTYQPYVMQDKKTIKLAIYGGDKHG